MAGFNITDLLNEETLRNARQDRKKIHYSKLIPNPKNTYSITGIDDLADSIEDSGLLQNLVVKPEGQDQYMIISGHRRWNAIKKIVEERGNSTYAQVDCLILPKDEDELQSLLKLHTTNLLARSLTEYEKMQAIQELETIYAQLAEKGMKPKGKVRDLIADQVDLKPTQVQKYMSISKKADQETLTNLKEGNITLEEAYQSTKNKPSKNNTEKPKEEKDMVKNICHKIRQLRIAAEEINEQNNKFLPLLELCHKMESFLIENGCQ